MKFEVLKKSHIKKNMIIGVIAVLIISAVILNFTRAKYVYTDKIPLINGTVNYSLADLNIVAITVDGESVDTIPEGNYELLDTSYCTIDGEEDESVDLSYDAATQMLTVTPFTTKGTKCYLNFETATTKTVNTILGNIEVNLDTPNFNNTSCSAGSNNGSNCGEETVGIYEETTSKGTTYYWRGDVDNNYLEFAGFYWRIIRINEDGSIRVIYSGNKATVDSAGKETVLANGYNDGSTDYTQIQTSAFNSSYNASEYVGYTFSEEYQRPSENPSTEEDSTIKEALETWYSNNLSGVDSKITSSPGFCNDRNLRNTEGEWVSTGSTQFYAAYERIFSTHQPTYECSNSNDLYQTKIGLITADEVIYAGAAGRTTNRGYYLYTGNYYWTMSPHYFYGGAFVFLVYSYGALNDYGDVSNTWGVRPVINISSDVTITGEGTIASPYVVS